MSARQGSALTAITMQLLAAIELYERDLGRVLVCRFDPDAYAQVSHHVDEMRMYASDLPQVSVAWVEVLIRHFELMHGVWLVGQGRADEAEVDRLRESQAQAILMLRSKCAALLANS